MPGGAGGRHGVGYSFWGGGTRALEGQGDVKQVLTCNHLEHVGYFQVSFYKRHLQHEPDTHSPIHARKGRGPRIMAPVIILGAIMVFVFWDTSEAR